MQCSFDYLLVKVLVAHKTWHWLVPKILFAQPPAEPGQDPPWVGQAPGARLSDLVLYALHCFRNTVRFVDDFTSGPDPLLNILQD